MIVQLVIPRIRGKPHQIRKKRMSAVKENRRIAMTEKKRIRRSEARERQWLKSASQNPRSPNEI